MAKARKDQINLDITPYYHCMTQCVRGAFLNGVDRETGCDYGYRKDWIVDEMKRLSSIFSIRVCVYAVMCNHYHNILYVDKAAMKQWTDEDILKRWAELYPDNSKVFFRRMTAKKVSEEEIQEKLLMWRERLISISWYMKFLNESVAKRANKEDGVKGHFWHNRFKSQALLDQAALLSAMAYVDLNPVRAGMAETPEDSDHTSIQERFMYAAKQLASKRTQDSPTLTDKINRLQQPPSLLRFANAVSDDEVREPTIPFSFSDYLALVDETGRILRQDKKGAIPSHFAPILERIGLEPKGWLKMVRGMKKEFALAVGNKDKLNEYASHFQRKKCKGQNFSTDCYIS